MPTAMRFQQWYVRQFYTMPFPLYGTESGAHASRTATSSGGTHGRSHSSSVTGAMNASLTAATSTPTNPTSAAVVAANPNVGPDDKLISCLSLTLLERRQIQATDPTDIEIQRILTLGSLRNALTLEEKRVRGSSGRDGGVTLVSINGHDMVLHGTGPGIFLQDLEQDKTANAAGDALFGDGPHAQLQLMADCMGALRLPLTRHNAQLLTILGGFEHCGRHGYWDAALRVFEDTRYAQLKRWRELTNAPLLPDCPAAAASSEDKDANPESQTVRDVVFTYCDGADLVRWCAGVHVRARKSTKSGKKSKQRH